MGRNITFKLVVPVIFLRGESLILTSHLLKRLLVLHRNDEGASLACRRKLMGMVYFTLTTLPF